MVVQIRTEEDRQASKEDRMRNHFGFNKHSNAPKMRTATQQMSTYSHTVGETAQGIGTKRAQMSEMNARVAAMQTSTYQNYSRNSELIQLKKELIELQAEVEAMRTSISGKVPKETPAAKEIAGLKKQVAELKAQLQTPEIPQHRSGMTARFQHRQTRRDENHQLRSGSVTVTRPRPGYCFRCGEDGHLAINCENDPNPSKVDEKKRQLRDKQVQWDLKNQATTTQLNTRQSL